MRNARKDKEADSDTDRQTDRQEGREGENKIIAMIHFPLRDKGFNVKAKHAQNSEQRFCGK